MTPPEPAFQAISPEAALREIAAAVPEDCRRHIIIIGSLAAGYHYRDQLRSMAVRTKDADCLLSPRVAAIEAGVAIAERLRAEGWEYWPTRSHPAPGTETTPDADLPALRLQPPDGSHWFIELLTVPEGPRDRGQSWTRMATTWGHFGLCSFGFLALADLDPIPTDLGIRIARPEMMALANLLEHPRIRPEIMSAGFANRPDIRRSNKDLGRVLAISRLAMARDEDALLAWPALWRSALRNRFPREWRDLARRSGNGLKELLASEPDLDQALYTCANGLLASRSPTLGALRITGKRLLADAIGPLETEDLQDG